MIPNYNVTCPRLICDQEYFQKLPESNQNFCFIMQTETPGQPIYARDCEIEKALQPQDYTPEFCEFDLLSGEYAWINETIQGADRCKSSCLRFDVLILETATTS